MSAHFAQFLEDFETPGSIVSVPMLSDHQTEQAEPTGISEAELQIAKSAAYDDGFNAAKLELEQQFEAKMAALTQEHAAEMERLTIDIGQNTAQQLISGLSAQTDAYCNQMTAQVTEILCQLIDQDIVERSIAELSQTIQTVLADQDQLKMKLSGPKNLLDMVCDPLKQTVTSLEIEETDGQELTVLFDDQILSTRLAQWRKDIGVKPE